MPRERQRNQCSWCVLMMTLMESNLWRKLMSSFCLGGNFYKWISFLNNLDTKSICFAAAEIWAQNPAVILFLIRSRCHVYYYWFYILVYLFIYIFIFRWKVVNQQLKFNKWSGFFSRGLHKATLLKVAYFLRNQLWLVLSWPITMILFTDYWIWCNVGIWIGI